MDDGLANILVFLDLSKGFDTLNIDILLHKLKSTGITAESLKWFNSYLTYRRHFVNVNNRNLSHRSDVLMGVPQRTVLGPILF